MDVARKTAFETLLRIHKDGAYSNLTLDAQIKDKGIEKVDAAFASAIVYTTVERLITIDYNLSLYLRDPLKKLKPEVLTALRMGASQILFMDKVPTFAAVNESVKLVKGIKSCSFASGLVNAVLRKIDANSLKLPSKDDKLKYISVKYSCPEWIVKLWTESYGEENAVGIMENSLKSSDTVIRVNTLKTDTKELSKSLMAEGVTSEEIQYLPNALIIKNFGSIENLESYRNGLFHVQGVASQLCCEALDVGEGQTVFDVCAAPGGKSFTLAQKMKNSGKLLSFDIYDHRVRQIETGAERLSVSNITARLRDASSTDEELETADRILCDVPCSGLGVIGKKPEIKYKNYEDIDKLTNLQYDILCINYRYLKKGGRLVYSTCSLNPSENEKICRRFLKEHPTAKAVPILEKIVKHETDNMVTLMPHINGTDGFFITAFCKTE